jgi:hypothetical protein
MAARRAPLRPIPTPPPVGRLAAHRRNPRGLPLPGPRPRPPVPLLRRSDRRRRPAAGLPRPSRAPRRRPVAGPGRTAVYTARDRPHPGGAGRALHRLPVPPTRVGRSPRPPRRRRDSRWVASRWASRHPSWRDAGGPGHRPATVNEAIDRAWPCLPTPPTLPGLVRAPRCPTPPPTPRRRGSSPPSTCREQCGGLDRRLTSSVAPAATRTHPWRCGPCGPSSGPSGVDPAHRPWCARRSSCRTVWERTTAAKLRPQLLRRPADGALLAPMPGSLYCAPSSEGGRSGTSSADDASDLLR